MMQQNDAVAVARSRYSYADTIARLTKIIEETGNRVFAMIDQAAAAQSVSMSLRPTTLIIFGNPKGGTGLMDAFPLFGLELPLKVLVWDDNGTANVAHARMSEVAARYGVTGHDAQISAMDNALDKFTASIT
jgi:uncharacterized protein (DUF302 family)